MKEGIWNVFSCHIYFNQLSATKNILHSIMFTLKWLHVQKDMADLCCFLAFVCMKHVLEQCLGLCPFLALYFWPLVAGTTTMESPLASHTTDRKWKTTKLCLDGRRKVLIVASFREIGIINALLTDLNVAHIICAFQ